jgi:pimeloyl-ACP methyl ester carboxylesterase
VYQSNAYGKTVLAIPGWTHTAETWEPFAEELFKCKECGISRVIAIDLPGHGKSSISPATAFGFLTFDNYVTAVIEVIDKLKTEKIYPEIIIAHSQGGLITQVTQQKYDLKRCGFKTAILLAPVVPRELKWNFLDTLNPAVLMPYFSTEGLYFLLPDFLWRAMFFTNAMTGEIAQSTPSEEIISANGYNTSEPLMSTLQLIGYDFNLQPDIGMRPSINPGIFNTLNLWVIGYDQDTLVRSEECELLFKYLSKDRKGGLIEISNMAGHETVHDLHISDPGFLLDEMMRSGGSNIFK